MHKKSRLFLYHCLGRIETKTFFSISLPLRYADRTDRRYRHQRTSGTINHIISVVSASHRVRDPTGISVNLDFWPFKATSTVLRTYYIRPGVKTICKTSNCCEAGISYFFSKRSSGTIPKGLPYWTRTTL